MTLNQYSAMKTGLSTISCATGWCKSSKWSRLISMRVMTAGRWLCWGSKNHRRNPRLKWTRSKVKLHSLVFSLHWWIFGRVKWLCFIVLPFSDPSNSQDEAEHQTPKPVSLTDEVVIHDEVNQQFVKLSTDRWRDAVCHTAWYHVSEGVHTHKMLQQQKQQMESVPFFWSRVTQSVWTRGQWFYLIFASVLTCMYHVRSSKRTPTAQKWKSQTSEKKIDYLGKKWSVALCGK